MTYFILSLLVFLGLAYFAYYQFTTKAFSRRMAWLTGVAVAIWFVDVILAAGRL